MAMLSLASCEDETENNSDPEFQKYFSMEITRCQRVSDVLIVDFKMKNTSGTNLQQVQLNGGSVTNMCVDDLGNKYYSEVSFGGDWATSARKSLKKNETLKGSFRITNYDKTNKSKKFNLKFRCTCNDLNFDGSGDIDGIKVVDKRVLFDGIDTNDSGLEYKLLEAETKNVDGKPAAFIKFSVKNNTGENLSNVMFNAGSVNNMFKTDTESFYGEISGNGSDYRVSATCRILNGETKEFTIRFKGTNSKVKELSGKLSCTTDSYVFSSDNVYFYDIKVQ